MLRRLTYFSKDCTRLFKALSLGKEAYLHQRHYSQASGNKRIHVLFCGSDDFSIASLNALHSYSQERDSNVASIDVAAKTDKRVGRGLKVIRPPPIKPVAQNLGLPVHQFDTFRGWNLPTRADGSNYIDLVIAVSFGLLVPPRILGSCQYGGLNVHPSMLPDLKGSSPIEYTIIHGYSKTGVTVQTLHPSKFDEGEIVMQTDEPGLDIPHPDDITSPELERLLAPKGAEMLVECIRQQRYLPSASRVRSKNDAVKFTNAPKFSSASRHINFKEMSLTHILRLNRAIGRLWTKVAAHGEQPETRFIYGAKMSEADASQLKAVPDDFLNSLAVGLPFNAIEAGQRPEESSLPLLVKTSDSRILSFPEITVSGMKTGSALASAAKAGILETRGSSSQQQIVVFRQPLC